MEKISWTDHVKNEVLQGVKEERNILNAKNEGSRTGFVTYCLGSNFSIALLKER